MALQPIYRKGMRAPDTRQEGVGLVDFSRAVKAGVDIQMGIDAANQRRGESIVKTQVELAKLPDTLAALHAGRIEAETRADIALATQEDKIAISAENLKAIQFENNELNMANKTSKIVAAMERRKLETQNMEFAATHGGDISAGTAMLASNPNKPVVLSQLKPLYEIASQNPTSPMAMKFIDLYNKTAVEVEQVTKQNFMKGLPAQMTPEGEPKTDENGQPVPDTDPSAVIAHADNILTSENVTPEAVEHAKVQRAQAVKKQQENISYQEKKADYEATEALVKSGVSREVALTKVKSDKAIKALGEGTNAATAQAITDTYTNKAKAFYINSKLFRKFKTSKSWEENWNTVGKQLQSQIDIATKDMEPNEKEIFISQLQLSFLNSQDEEYKREQNLIKTELQEMKNSAIGDRQADYAQGTNSMDKLNASQYASMIGEHGYFAGFVEGFVNLSGHTMGVKGFNAQVEEAKRSPGVGQDRDESGNFAHKSSTLPFRVARRESDHAIFMLEKLLQDPRAFSIKQQNKIERTLRVFKAFREYTTYGFHTESDDIQDDALKMYAALDELHEASTGHTTYNETKTKFISMSQLIATQIDSLGIEELKYNSPLYRDKGLRLFVRGKVISREQERLAANRKILLGNINAINNLSANTYGVGTPDKSTSSNSRQESPPIKL